MPILFDDSFIIYFIIRYPRGIIIPNTEPLSPNPLDINSFTDISNPDRYDAVFPKVQQFVSDCINQLEPDYILAVHRKGRRMIYDLVDHQFHSFIMSDSNILFDMIKNKHVLIFDDSIGTGATVKSDCEQIEDLVSSVSIVTILCNYPAIDSLRSGCPKIKEIRYLRVFDDYQEQSEAFTSLYPLIEASSKRLGNGFPSAVIDVDWNVDSVSVWMINFLRDKGYDVMDDDKSQVMGHVGSRGFTAYIFEDLSAIGISEDDAKIRISVSETKSGSEVIIELIITPDSEYISSKLGPDHNIEDFTKAKDEICISFLKTLVDEIECSFKEKGVLCMGDTRIVPPYERVSQ